MAGLSGDDALNLAKSYVKKTLQGEGALKGKDGKDGSDGKSAYQVALDNGFEGTEEEWLESLKARSVEISKKENNALEEKEDGLYVGFVGKTYKSLEELGLVAPIEVYAIESSLSVNDKFVGVVTTTQVTDIPGNGVLNIEIMSTSHSIAKFYMNDSWYAGVENNYRYTWNKVAYEEQVLSLNGGSFNENPQITIPSTDGHAWIGILDNGYATNITADIIHIVNTNESKDTMIEAGGISTPSLTVDGKKVVAPKYEYLKFTTDNSSITIGEIAVFIADMGDFLVVNIGGTCEVTETKAVLTLPHTTYTNKNYNTANGQLISISGSSSTDITLASFYVNESGVGLRLNNTETDAIRIWGTVTLYKK